MYKKGFTIIEVVVVFLLILAAAFFIIPTSLDSTKQARLISKWTEKFSELQYMFSAIKVQHQGTIKNSLEKAKNKDDKEQILLEIIKPYLRITSNVNTLTYKQHYMNGSLVKLNDIYYFYNFYNTSSDEIIGLKYIDKESSNKGICAIISFDLNGNQPPNTWGYDIFGIKILKDRISPIGKGMPTEMLRSDCSKRGLGVYCSYYYLIGGHFD